MEQSPVSPACAQCQQRLTDRCHSRCRLCRVVSGGPEGCVPAPVTLASSAAGDAQIVALRDDSVKAVALRQWFLSKWYGRCGVTIRIDSVVALYSATQTEAYNNRMEDVLRRARETTQFPLANERRMFLQQFPATFCELWVPSSPSSSSSSLPSPLPPCSPASDAPCEACLLMRGGPGGLSRAGTVRAVHDPFLIDASTGGGSICGSDGSSRQRSPIQRRLCIICRVVLGKVGWLNWISHVPRHTSATPTTTVAGATPPTSNTSPSSSAVSSTLEPRSMHPGGTTPTASSADVQEDVFDSYVVEEQTEKCFFAFPDASGVLPTYCIAFSMRE